MGSIAGDDISVFSDRSSAANSDEKISVSVRLRPLNENETNKNDVSDWECISTNTIVYKNTLPERSLFPTAYSFDRVFSPDCSTKQVYEEAAKEISLSAVGGINSSVFAYGQTSSGKTYTMSGITQYAVSDIYDYIHKHPEREFVLKFSAIEIYNEAVRDLLGLENVPLRLLDDPERGTVVEKLTEEILRDDSHLMELLSVCEAQRQIGETTLNEASSRSHQILRLSIESSAREYQGAGSSSTLTAYVDFVDLAGSERASQTLSTGTRLKEGSHINRSLLTLGTVIRKLSKGRNAHVPFRDSKLTRILQNSLGGNARTAIICTMSPAHTHVEQSRNTLFFASCAKEITTKAQVNIVMSEKALVKQLQRELARMENEIKSLESASTKSNFSSKLKEKEVLIEKMESEIKDLIQQRDLAQSRVDELLRSASEDGASRLDDLWPAQHHFMREFDHRPHSRLHDINRLVLIDSEDQQLQLSDIVEDDFLLDDTAPRFSGPDPCQGWEEMAQKYSEHPEYSCKDVQCIEIEESSMNKDENEFNHSSRNEDDSQSSPDEKDGNSEVVIEDGTPKGRESDNAHQDQTDAMEGRESKNAHQDQTGPMEGRESDNAHQDQTDAMEGRESDNAHQDQPDAVEGKESDNAHQDQTDAMEGRKSDNAHQDQTDATERRESNNAHQDQTDAMKLKVQELQKALEYFIKQYPVMQTDYFTTADRSSPEHLELSKSKSGRSVLTIPCCSEQVASDPENLALSKSTSGRSLLKIPSSWVEKTPSDGYEKDCNHDRKLSRNNSQSSIESYVTQMSRTIDHDDDKTSVLNFVVRPNTIPNIPSEKYFGDNTGASPLASNWYLVFERQRKQIIELWDACNAPLAHRSCFFLLFKGEPSDSVYMEVELRRLLFLKNIFSQGNPKGSSFRESQSLAQALSSKALKRERDMLSKQVQKLFPRKEREILYQKWAIALDTKQRSRKLSQQIWRETSDLSHISESAKLVARLVGLGEQDQAPKEIFGLSFSPGAVGGRSRETFGICFTPKSRIKRTSSSISNLPFCWKSMSTVA